MKIAYLGYDLSSVRTDAFFKSKDLQVSYFLTYPHASPSYLPFGQTGLLTEKIMIDAISNDRTSAQASYFDKLKKQHAFLQNELACAEVKSVEFPASSENPSVINDMQTIIDIQYESKSKKVLIEIEKHGVEEFDFIISEQHILISLELEKRNIFLFNKSLKTPLVWTTFSFRLNYADGINYEMKNSSFFLILDPDRESVSDNWFHCQMVGKRLYVSTLLPYTQVMNPSFQKFSAERIQQQLREKIQFVVVSELESVTLSTVAADYKSNLLRIKAAGVVPNFSFWTDAQINSYLQKQTLKKINKINLNTPGIKAEAEL